MIHIHEILVLYVLVREITVHSVIFYTRRSSARFSRRFLLTNHSEQFFWTVNKTSWDCTGICDVQWTCYSLNFKLCALPIRRWTSILRQILRWCHWKLIGKFHLMKRSSCNKRQKRKSCTSIHFSSIKVQFRTTD